MIAKILTAFAAGVAFMVISGLTGLTFYLWPTYIGDHKLAITPQVLGQLEKLQAERKFDADMRFYPGARNEVARVKSQTAVDAVIASLRTALPARPQRSTVLRKFKSALATYSEDESEERDQFLVYLSKVMDIVGMSNSGELLNVWRYGFPYGWVI